MAELQAPDVVREKGTSGLVRKAEPRHGGQLLKRGAVFCLRFYRLHLTPEPLPFEPSANALNGSEAMLRVRIKPKGRGSLCCVSMRHLNKKKQRMLAMH